MNNLIYDSPSKKNTIFLPKSDKKSSSNKYVSETDTLAKLKCKDELVPPMYLWPKIFCP